MTKVWNSQDSQMVFGSFRRPASEVNFSKYEAKNQ